jgi:hypothetical protein
MVKKFTAFNETQEFVALVTCLIGNSECRKGSHPNLGVGRRFHVLTGNNNNNNNNNNNKSIQSTREERKPVTRNDDDDDDNNNNNNNNNYKSSVKNKNTNRLPVLQILIDDNLQT